jgi:hypothetical protein
MKKIPGQKNSADSNNQYSKTTQTTVVFVAAKKIVFEVAANPLALSVFLRSKCRTLRGGFL